MKPPWKLWELPLCPPVADYAGQMRKMKIKKDYKKTTLKNGLRIITIPQKETRAVTILVLVGTGSKYEAKEVSGISHFVEHMFFKGTEKRKTTKEVADFLDKFGGDFDAFTGEEYTGYYAKVDGIHFDKALEWVSDIFLNSKLPALEMERERGVIIEEIKMHEDNAMRHIYQVWSELLYGDQPSGWDLAGTRESVSKISRTDLMDYVHTQYVAKNTVICVAGNIDEKGAIEKVKKYFSKIRKTDFKRKPDTVELQNGPQLKLKYKNVEQANLALGVRSFDTFHPDRYALRLLAVILGGTMGSRLFTEVREKLGAAYYVGTYNEDDTDTGYFATFAGVDDTKLEKVITAILKEYGRVAREKVSAEELKKAKDFMKGKMVLGLESSDAKASFYANQELLKNKILAPEEIFELIDRVTAGDIQRVAKEIFKTDRLNLAMITKFKEEDKFKKLLKI
jgi:predicted Zn-dependent peptidase